jgi:hypothetical protein
MQCLLLFPGKQQWFAKYPTSLLTEVQQLKSLADSILDVHVDFENQCSDNKNSINSGWSIDREKCNHLSQESSTILDLQQMRSKHLSA